MGRASAMGCVHLGPRPASRGNSQGHAGSFLWSLCQLMGSKCQAAPPWGRATPSPLWLRTLSPAGGQLGQAALTGSPDSLGLQESDSAPERFSLLPSPSPHTHGLHTARRFLCQPCDSNDNVIRGGEGRGFLLPRVTLTSVTDSPSPDSEPPAGLVLPQAEEGGQGSSGVRREVTHPADGRVSHLLRGGGLGMWPSGANESKGGDRPSCLLCTWGGPGRGCPSPGDGWRRRRPRQRLQGEDAKNHSERATHPVPRSPSPPPRIQLTRGVKTAGGKRGREASNFKVESD